MLVRADVPNGREMAGAGNTIPTPGWCRGELGIAGAAPADRQRERAEFGAATDTPAGAGAGCRIAGAQRAGAGAPWRRFAQV